MQNVFEPCYSFEVSKLFFYSGYNPSWIYGVSALVYKPS